ncbi:MAG: Gfo/Idh/MocA family oxidoreductase [Lentisphaerae bacterium]|jgi:predicted dehydrogenase|nr:Gfo/Idh/MocA family oxidoreductase [Lentisphaerota bacterium]MBT4814058.1 Gfo/Idh/MocA family oxidoreductase [Lentisphaerota bacterium]MBT5607841.1 Gfo/Idh/MocA family oxidoreductase [Lentisphaerota bacterium]MBT7054823.1 Gfo/Idh/MocA family oxidoreductase [Lentisphaerota bacterium]MBT7845563.1 Gfo/Idh/MocA family oxidoreductase [Lentisphaerota bacterium]
MDTPIRVGVYGAGRGAHLGSVAQKVGMKLVAICESFGPLLNRVRKKSFAGEDITYYRDYDKFLDHDLDAVIVANYATEHTSAVIKALAADKHVLSECMAMFTMAEAVQLVEAVEASEKVYFFAENVPFNAQCLEMTRLYKNGDMGDFLYGEAEYIHPGTPQSLATLVSGPSHWRAWIPVTYYCTHSLGPVMMVTDTRPVKVNGFLVPYDFNDPKKTGGISKRDTASILMCTMDNSALAKIMPCASLRDHGYRIRFCCNKGTMEYNQGQPQLRVHREPFDFDPPKEANTFYMPEFPEEFKQAATTGHGGADYFCAYYFAKAIREGSTPLIDVYKAIDMTSVGILGYRSALQGGIPLEVPDFRDKTVRETYRNDDWNPDPARHREGMPFPSILGDIPISDESMKRFDELRKAHVEGMN